MASAKAALVKLLFLVFVIAGIAAPFWAHAQSENTTTALRARIVRIVSVGSDIIPGTTVVAKTQKIDVVFTLPDGTPGSDTLDNDYYSLPVGAKVWINRIVSQDGSVTYAVFEPDRTNLLIFFAILFLVVLAIFGGIQGLRGILSLVGGFLLIAYVLIPGILHGYSPILISILVASLITVVGSYVTHGINRTTSAAVLGMIGTVIITGILSWAAVHFGHLTGVATDEAVYLNINSGGTLNMSGILLGAILIGLLGVLYDVAIGQAIAVEELYRANHELPHAVVFKRAMRIGREHIGALVNTLAIAYVGVSLPLILLFAQASWEQPLVTINRELFATEILRTLVGSIGLILAVPITTALAVYLLRKVDWKQKASHHGHSHSLAE